ncbi:MAG: hypothetical protein ACXVBJ_04585 [Flavisolibacter sp.]
MPALIFRGLILCLLISSLNTAKAQKEIVIDDSLAANATKLNVKMGGQGFGKTWKFHFGDYGVVSSKMGWTTTSSKGNFFNTKTESKSTEKFSFIMTNKRNDSARVNTANNIKAETLQEVELLPNFYFEGNDVLLFESTNFSAYITINSDTTETWSLLMNITSGLKTAGSYKALLTNGEKKIFLSPVYSDVNQSFPAKGYEFFENEKSVGAVQYLGSGMLGYNKNIVWIDNRLDEKMKLILAAAMTAIMQKQMNEVARKN